MSKPPKQPLKMYNKKQNKNIEIDYFEKLIMLTKEYLKEDGIYLNFKGYREVKEKYSSLEENDVKKAWTLVKELNAWSEYFSEIANLIQKKYLDSETRKIEVQSLKSMKHSEKVNAGDRYSNTDKDVIYSRKKRNALKSLYDELNSKIKFLERAHYHCKSTCEWNNKLKTSFKPQINSKDDIYES